MGTLARNSLKTFRCYIQHKGLSFYDLLLNFLFLLEDYQGNWKYVESNNKPNFNKNKPNFNKFKTKFTNSKLSPKTSERYL